MAEEGQGAGVGGNAAGAFDYAGGVLLDGLGQFDAAIESMDVAGEGVAGFQVGGFGGRTAQEGTSRSRQRPWRQARGSRTSKPRLV